MTQALNGSHNKLISLGKVLSCSLAMVWLWSHTASALSEIKPTNPDSVETGDSPTVDEKPLPPLQGPQVGPDGGLPMPDPVIRRNSDEAPAALDEQDEEQPVAAPAPPAWQDAEIITDIAKLPPPAARMRQLIIEAAKSGDPEKLRMLLGTGPTATRLSLGGIEDDPVAYLKAISGDGEGREILAIILDLLEVGFVHLDAGTPDEAYVWPHFVTSDLEKLTPQQEVELLRIVTAGDLEDMRAFGGYNFFRIGITPDGQWRFLLAGD